MMPPRAVVPHVCSRPRWWQRRTLLGVIGGYWRLTTENRTYPPGVQS